MNKIRVTKKQMQESYKNIISVGYCSIQNLLKPLQPRYYTCGIYGWKSDIYEIDYNTIIVTGYAPFGNIESNYKINKKYNEKAYKLYSDYSQDYQKQNKKVEKLLKKYVDELLGGI